MKFLIILFFLIAGCSKERPCTISESLRCRDHARELSKEGATIGSYSGKCYCVIMNQTPKGYTTFQSNIDISDKETK